MAKNTIAKVVKEPMHYELAEWFMENRKEAMSHEVIARRIQKIKEKRGLQLDRNGIPYYEYQSFINQCRAYLETKFQLTLVNLKFPGENFGAYQIADDRQATEYGVRQYKRLIVQTERVRRITPLIKRQYITTAVKKVFGEAEEEVQRFYRLGQKFLPAYETDVEAAKEKEEAKK